MTDRFHRIGERLLDAIAETERVVLAVPEDERRWWYDTSRYDETVTVEGTNIYVAAGVYGPLEDRYGEHIARNDPFSIARRCRADRRVVREWMERTTSTFEGMTEEELHQYRAHPAWDYKTTEGPRKRWDDVDVPPEGEGWVLNTAAGRNGWERFDYTEERYWRRPRAEPYVREPRKPPFYIRELAVGYGIIDDEEALDGRSDES